MCYCNYIIIIVNSLSSFTMSSPRKDPPEKKGKRSRPTVPVENQSPPAQLSQEHIQAILDGVSEFRNVKRELAGINEKLLKLHMLDILSSQVSELKTSVDFAHKEIEDMKVENTELKDKVRDLTRKVDNLANERENLSNRITDLQARSMRDNLLFFGVKEEFKEDCESVLRAALESQLKMSDAQPIKFARVHRMGRRSTNKTRPVVAKFEVYKERELVRQAFFAELKALKERNEAATIADLQEQKLGISIAEQYPQEIQQKRRELLPIMKEARKAGKETKLIRDKLYINGQLFRSRFANGENMNIEAST